MRVCTYNLLSPALNNIGDNDVRFRNILKYLEKKYFDVLALQEVSSEWYCEIARVLEEKDMVVRFKSHSGSFHGHMGNLLAVKKELNPKFTITIPTDNMKLKKDSYCIPSYVPKAFYSLYEYFYPKPHMKSMGNLWGGMKNKSQALIMADIGDIRVGCYHMPCHFGTKCTDIQMTAFLASVMKDMGNGKCVLLGDFNIQHDSMAYEFITRGEICNGSEVEYTLDGYIVEPMKDIHSDMKDKLYTTYVNTEHAGGEFCAKLDYIFMRDVKCVGIKKLPLMKDGKPLVETKYMPNSEYPSDHHSLSAIFDI